MSKPLRGLILAAGTGTRLRPLTHHRPKPLLDIGGQCLLERLVRICARAALQEVVVVTGHASDAVERWLAAHDLPIPVRTVFNEHYATLNNAQSVLVARGALAGEGFVQFDGDLLLDAGIVDGLLQSPWPSAIAVDGDAGRDAEAMKVGMDCDGRITALGKWLPVADSAGEAIGVGKFAAQHTKRLFDAIEHIVHSEGRGDAYYEDVYHWLVGDGWELGAQQTAGLSWAEVDDQGDLARARALVAELAS